MYGNPNYGESYGVTQRRFDSMGGSFQPQYQPMNNIIWVQGEAGAKGYQVPPNSNVILMDNDDLILYIKSTDNVGMTSMRSFRLTEITNESPNGLITQKANINYVTREEFEELKGMIEDAKSNFFTNASNENKPTGGNSKSNGK